MNTRSLTVHFSHTTEQWTTTNLLCTAYLSIHPSIHPTGCLSGGLSVHPFIHPRWSIPSWLPSIYLATYLNTYLYVWMSIYVSLPLYLFIWPPICLCVCLCDAIGQCGPWSSPFHGCIMLFINVGPKYRKRRTESTDSTFPPTGSERTIPVLDRYSHRLLDRMHRKMFTAANEIPYIIESNPHHFHSFRGLKNQMRIRIACGLDSRSWAGFWKNDRAAVRAVRTIQYNNLFYLLFIIYIIYYIIFIIYYSSDSPSSLITESLSVTQSLSSLSSPSSSHRCRLEPRTNFIFV